MPKGSKNYIGWILIINICCLILYYLVKLNINLFNGLKELKNNHQQRKKKQEAEDKIFA